MVLADRDLRALAALAVDADLLVITDEVYEHLSSTPRSICRWRPTPGWPSAR